MYRALSGLCIAVLASFASRRRLAPSSAEAPTMPAWAPMKFTHRVVFTIAMDTDPAINARLTVAFANRLARNAGSVAARSHCRCARRGSFRAAR